MKEYSQFGHCHTSNWLHDPLFRNSLFHPKTVHFHAGHMDLQPYWLRALQQNEQLAKAHLHEGIGDVVHIHRRGATWNNWFHSIHFSIDTGCLLKGT